MFSCLYKLIWIRSDPTPSPKDTGEQETMAPSSPSPRKRREWTVRRVSSLRCLRRGSLSPPILLLPALLSPPDPDSSCHLMKTQERRRPGLFRLLLQGKGDKDRATFVSSVVSPSSSPLFSPFSSFPSYFSCYPPPLRPDTCIGVCSPTY